MQKLQIDVDMMCRRIGLSVSPVRTSSFEILGHLMLGALTKEPGVNAAALAPLFEGFDACCEMLERGVPAAFRELGAPAPEALEAARVEALAATRDVAAPLRRLAQGWTRPSPDGFRRLSDQIDQELRPAIGRFLTALNEFARAESERRRSETRGIVASTIAEVERFSLAIKLISINVSIEAAHAGAAGRGFAVIAAEIRALSDKSSQALDLIRRKIG